MQIPAEQCRALFAAARVARFATADAAGRPHLVPVTFAVVDESVVFAVDAKPKSTTRLRRLRNIEENPQVSLLVDEYAEDWRALWWVRADGLARVRPQGGATPVIARAAALLRAKYPQYAELGEAAMPGPFVEIAVTRWSGWRYAAAGPAPDSAPRFLP